ncbi:MAG: hypothetical protein Fur0037_21320 [Planctomycetota bacterium]
MRLSIYAHPFDLRALDREGGIGRLAALGFSEIAVAAAYHAGRWLQPWNEEALVRELEDGTVHFRPRADYGLLEPLPSSEVPREGPGPLRRLVEEAPAAGLAARAWAVGAHNSRLGALHPDSCVRNACGDRYRHALCPARPEVERHLGAMIEDLSVLGFGSIEIESFAAPGYRHRSHHDKNSFSDDPAAESLLSVCFCPSCERGLSESHDVEIFRSRAQAWLRQRFRCGDAMRTEPVALSEELDAGIRAAAAWRGQVLRRQLLSWSRRSRTPLSLQGSFDTRRNVPSSPLFELADVAKEIVLTTYGVPGQALDDALAARRMGRGRGNGMGGSAVPLRVAIHPKAPEYSSDGDLLAAREACERHGVDTVAIYHLGLLPWRTIERAAKAFGGGS